MALHSSYHQSADVVTGHHTLAHEYIERVTTSVKRETGGEREDREVEGKQREVKERKEEETGGKRREEEGKRRRRPEDEGGRKRRG